MGVLAPVAEEAWVDRAAGEVRRRDAQSGVVIGGVGQGVGGEEGPVADENAGGDGCLDGDPPVQHEEQKRVPQSDLREDVGEFPLGRAARPGT
ncbi:MAG: hypothetical protein RL077_1626 [Verrucomicrobiota bacterium]